MEDFAINQQGMEIIKKEAKKAAQKLYKDIYTKIKYSEKLIKLLDHFEVRLKLNDWIWVELDNLRMADMRHLTPEEMEEEEDD